MAEIKFKGNRIHTAGELPAVDSKAPDFVLVKGDLSELSLRELAGKKVILNVFVSIDTPVCAASVRRFNEEAAKLPNCVVLCVSADLPFASARFCSAAGINNVWPVSVFRNPEFGQKYGLRIMDGPLAGLLARAVVVVNPDGKVVYAQLVDEITKEPDYEAALVKCRS